MTTTDYPKKPPTYLSFATNNPTTKRHIYFTCPIVAKYGYGHDSTKERTDGTQDFRDKVRKVLGWAIRDGKITAEEYNSELEIGYDAIKTAEKEDRNEPKYNPEYLEWVENKPKKTPTNKTKKEHTENRYVMLENRNTELMRELEELKKELEGKNEEIEGVREENDDLNYQMENEHKTIDEYDEMYERKEHYKKLYNDLVAEQNEPKVEPKKTNKGKKYKTKNAVIEEVVNELIEDAIDL
tara:strand:+ start:66 stop:785 length:720 start_codon:yes stop_codon:yes gene_type:complete